MLPKQGKLTMQVACSNTGLKRLYLITVETAMFNNIDLHL